MVYCCSYRSPSRYSSSSEDEDTLPQISKRVKQSKNQNGPVTASTPTPTVSAASSPPVPPLQIVPTPPGRLHRTLPTPPVCLTQTVATPPPPVTLTQTVPTPRVSLTVSPTCTSSISQRTISLPSTVQTLSTIPALSTSVPITIYTHTGSTGLCPSNLADTSSSRTSSRLPAPRTPRTPRSPAGSISGMYAFIIHVCTDKLT